MLLTEKRKLEIEEEEKYRHAVVKSIKHSNQLTTQKHGVPLILSLIIPGLGQLVKGQVKKGLFIFFGPAIVFSIIIIFGILTGNANGNNNSNGLQILNLLSNYFIAYIILYIWQLIDAYNN